MSELALRAYHAMPVWVQNALLTAYGLRLRRLRYGAQNRKILEDLLASQWLTAEEIHDRQLSALNELVRHARANVPFYRARDLPERIAHLDDLARMPLLRKTDLLSQGKAFVGDEVAASAHEVHTGGTTGTPLTIYCSRATLQRNYAFFERLKAWAHIPPRSRTAVFAGRLLVPPSQARPPYWRRNRAANTLMLSSYHLSPQTAGDYLSALREFRPELIDSYPSSIEFVARSALKLGVEDIRPRAVITSSETLTPEARDIIQRAFGCPVFDHYGSAEMAAFVSQCEVGSYHVNPEFGIVEIIREDGTRAPAGEEGHLVATGFINPVMPLIRYATGDQAVQGEGTCSCGRAFPILARIAGRVDDVLVTPDGRRIGRLDPIFKSNLAIREARIVQDAVDHVRIEVVPETEFSSDEEAALARELSRRLGPSMRVDVVRVPSVPREASGKLRMVVREIPSPPSGAL